jgi:hypothetical protein
MINLLKSFLPKPKPTAKVWLIDPTNQSISEIDNPHIPSLVADLVGDDAESFKLDNNDNVALMSDTDTNTRYAYFWDSMPYPFNVRRYSKALVVSLGPTYWSQETIEDWICWHDKNNPWGDI